MHAIKRSFKQALEQAPMSLRAQMWTRRDCVYSTGITANTTWCKDRFRSITGQQPYIVP